MGQEQEKDSIQEEKEEIEVNVVQSDQAAKHTAEDITEEELKEELSKSAPVVLTGGHGGAVPAFIVKVIQKIFLRSKNT